MSGRLFRGCVPSVTSSSAAGEWRAAPAAAGWRRLRTRKGVSACGEALGVGAHRGSRASRPGSLFPRLQRAPGGSREPTTPLQGFSELKESRRDSAAQHSGLLLASAEAGGGAGQLPASPGSASAPPAALRPLLRAPPEQSHLSRLPKEDGRSTGYRVPQQVVSLSLV